MAAVVGRVWGWVSSWGGCGAAKVAEKRSRSWGWSSWIWGGRRRQSEEGSLEEEFWEAPEKLQPVEAEGVGLGPAPPWWGRLLPTSYLPWLGKEKPRAPGRWKRGDGRDGDADGELSDYGTPPPSPTPSSPLTSPFRLFTHSWSVEILPDHYEICFNFLRHLFDLLVVGFLWTVSPPAKVILEVLGVHGPLRLWFHGMAMFLVSTVGMAGLLWLVQEYLAQFALIYGVVQAAVISVSVKQSVLLSVGGDSQEREEPAEELGTMATKGTPPSTTEKMKTS